MKTFITLIIAIFCSFTTVFAQNYTQNGTTFVENKTKKSSAIETKYTYEDKNGKSHKIFLSKNGKAFIKVTSKKTGNEYNKYLDDELSIKLSKEYNITYVSKKK